MTLLGPRAIHDDLARLLSRDDACLVSSEPYDTIESGAEATFCDMMWSETETKREQALQTHFVQNIKTGKLDPVVFGGYMVQDAVYCKELKDSLKKAAARCDNKVLREFLDKKAENYQAYSEELFQKWHIDNASGISLGDACKRYVKVLIDTAEESAPIYLLVASIPCARLWPWIGIKLKEENEFNKVKGLSNSETDFGCYSAWVAENFKADRTSYTKYEQKVDNYPNLDTGKARKIYQQCMEGEAEFFGSAIKPKETT